MTDFNAKLAENLDTTENQQYLGKYAIGYRNDRPAIGIGCMH